MPPLPPPPPLSTSHPPPPPPPPHLFLTIPLQADKRELLEEAKEASILEGGLSTRLLDSRISSMVDTLRASELGAT